MKVLLIGSGGRENALAFQIAKSPSLEMLFIAPGNHGTAFFGKNVKLDLSDFNEVADFCSEENIDLVIVGPEKPLVDGLADHLRYNNIKVFGPSKFAAQIEGDKAFAKNLMAKNSIPTADFKEFSKDSYSEAIDYIQQNRFPIVIKANGLAAGKGVIIANTPDEAVNALNVIFQDNIFDKAGDKVVIEEFLYGEEASIFAITDGENFITLPAAQDHKRVGNDDTGKNTGGMGAYAPAPLVNNEVLEKVRTTIIQPTLKALELLGARFIGCLYCGLMIDKNGNPSVVEFNCRFGDPETQAVLPLLEGDFLKLLFSAAEGRLDPQSTSYNDKSAVCVILSSKGYPDDFERGFEIFGLTDVPDDILIFHSGTIKNDKKIFTNGGRVLGITGISGKNDIKAAKDKAYEAIKSIKFNNMYYRTDISDKALK